MTHQDPTALPEEEARNLGVGIGFLPNWDFDVENGSFGLITGIEVLARDIAVGLQRDGNSQRSGLLDRDRLADIEITTKRILNNDDRVSEIIDITAERADDTNRKVEVSVTFAAETGSRGEFVVKT
jgi:hypothetical protein